MRRSEYRWKRKIGCIDDDVSCRAMRAHEDKMGSCIVDGNPSKHHAYRKHNHTNNP